MSDEAVRQMAARQAAWDPLRERRVLARIEAELARRPARRRAPWIAAAVGALAAVAVAVLAWPSPGELGSGTLAGLGELAEPAGVAAPAVPSGPAIPTLPAAAIALGDGSIATLHDGARIELRTQTAEEIRIEQSIGRVHYDVRPGLPRSFVVDAADVRVSVIGTAFWVTREADAVRVTVEHGRVRVARAADATIAELGAGDELRVDTTVAPAPAERTVRAPAKGRRSRDDAAARPDVDALLATADLARGHGDLAAAAAALREVVERHGSDPRAYGSAFQLGKVERSRGRHGAAARAFAAAARKSPSGALSEDARAEAAISWFDAGDLEAARRAGEDYLARHPAGTHVARVQRMLQRIP